MKSLHQTAKYTLKFKLRSDRKSRDGKYPLVIQCFLDGQKTVINTGDSLPKSSWDEKNSRVKPSKDVSADQAEEINLTIGEIKQHIERLFYQHRRSGNLLTPEKLKRSLSNPEAHSDFHAWVQVEIDKLVGARAESTMRHYRSTFKVFKEFRPDLRIADLSHQLVEEWEIFLQKRGLTPNGRAKYHKHLKRFSRILMKDDQIPNIYMHHRIRQNKAQRVFLNRHEVETLEAMFDNQAFHPALHIKLGRFLFSCHTGIRGEGLNAIHWDNYADGFVTYYPQKLRYISKAVKVPISNAAMRFIEFEEGNMFSQLSNQKYNVALATIARKASIKKRMTSHVGRHTFATGFLLSGGNLRVLQDYLGHSKLETTEIYVHMTSDREKEERHILEHLYKKPVAGPETDNGKK